MPKKNAIAKFGGEKIAFYLHKKNDFVQRLEKNLQNTVQHEDQ